jgi:hypothetical protein
VKKLNSLQLMLICVAFAILAIIWTAGVATDAFSNSAFQSFWWLSKTDANSAVIIVAPSLIGATVLIGESLWLSQRDSKV